MNQKKKTKFVSGAYKLVEGKHLNSKDKHQILMHKDLAAKNHLKSGEINYYSVQISMMQIMKRGLTKQ